MKVFSQPTRFNDLVLSEQNASNAGLVTVTGALTTVASSVSFNVFDHQWVWLQSRINMTKGGVAGSSLFTITKLSGTATITWWGTSHPYIEFPGHPAASALMMTLNGLFKVTVSGTLVLALRAISNGSNGTVNAGNGMLRTMIMDRL